MAALRCSLGREQVSTTPRFKVTGVTLAVRVSLVRQFFVFIGIYEPLQDDKIKKFEQFHRAVEPACDVAGRSSLPLRFLALMAQPSSPAAAHVSFLPCCMWAFPTGRILRMPLSCAKGLQLDMTRHGQPQTSHGEGVKKNTLQWQNKQTENNLKMGNSILCYFPAVSLSPIQKQARACSNWISVTTQ